MVRKDSLYKAAAGIWFFAVLGVGFGILIGFAEPYVSSEQIPYGGQGLFGAMIGAIAVGIFVISRLHRRSWIAAGRELGLEPEGGVLTRTTALVGTVNGRDVRVDTYKVSVQGEGNTKRTYTLVEADLAQPVERGFFLGPHGGPENEAEDDLPGELGMHDIAGEYYALGDVSETAASRLLTDEVRDAFRAGAGSVVVGNPTGAFTSTMSGDDGTLGSGVRALTETALSDKEGLEESTVAHTRKGHVLEPDLLRPQIDAVAAVADAYETADTRTPRA